MNMYFETQKKREWTEWIHRDVALDTGAINHMTRWKATQAFLQNGILPLAKRYGFSIPTPISILNAQLLRIIFELSRGKKVNLASNQKDYPQQYYDLYLQTVDTYAWDRLWNEWGDMEDFSDSAYGYKVQAILPIFLWNQLNLDSSPAILALEEELEDEEEFQDYKPTSKMKDDPYILDQGVSYLDRHKH